MTKQNDQERLEQIEKTRSEIIKRVIDSNKETIRGLYESIKELQEQCPHYGMTKTPGANTGNWCKADDEYWYDYNCPYCGFNYREYKND